LGGSARLGSARLGSARLYARRLLRGPTSPSLRKTRYLNSNLAFPTEDEVFNLNTSPSLRKTRYFNSNLAFPTEDEVWSRKASVARSWLGCGGVAARLGSARLGSARLYARRRHLGPTSPSEVGKIRPRLPYGRRGRKNPTSPPYGRRGLADEVGSRKARSWRGRAQKCCFLCGHATQCHHTVATPDNIVV
jgi:hypothetical protein